LCVDPKEEVPELNYLNDTWVDFPLYQVLEDHEASIEEDPGTPDPLTNKIISIAVIIIVVNVL
jgi:arylsulfatase